MHPVFASLFLNRVKSNTVHSHLFFPTAFNLDYYTEVLDLEYLLEHLSNDPFFRKYKKLNEALIGVVEDYSLVSFIPLSVQVCMCACVYVVVTHQAKINTTTLNSSCDNHSPCNCMYQDKESMMEVARQVDRANGYVYSQGPGGEEASLAAMMSTAIGADFDFFKYPS